MKLKATIVSGYFNPLHKGHIEYFHLAKAQGNQLFVIVNNDYQRVLKGSKEFMLEEERSLIVNELELVDEVFLSIDQDRTVCATLEKIYKNYSKTFELFFANGGDQNSSSSPETPVCRKIGIGIIDRLGDKIQSSSWLLRK
tara:strand:+ start:154 stop:576 length:423 start_codon:yes stop_codon:yes gene_type:complete